MTARFVIVKPSFLGYNYFVRLDLFLKTTRLIKRRSIAREMCDDGRVLVNGHPAKPAREVRPSDVITLSFSSRRVDLEVLAVPAGSPGKKGSPGDFYRIESETRVQKEKDLWSENPS